MIDDIRRPLAVGSMTVLIKYVYYNNTAPGTYMINIKYTIYLYKNTMNYIADTTILYNNYRKIEVDTRTSCSRY